MANKPSGSGDRRQSAREQQRLQAAKDQKRRRLVQILVVAAVAVVALGIVGSAILIGHLAERNGTPALASTQVDVGGAQVPIKIDGSAVVVGKDDAKVKLDLWVDYSCPHCKEFEDASNQVIADLVAKDTLQVKYHNVQIVTAFGRRAGSAGACVAVNEPDKWWNFNTQIYANQPQESGDGSDVDLNALAEQQGATGDETQKCITNEQYKGWITDNTAAFGENGMTGTPTLQLNGKTEATVSGDQLRARVEELAKG